MIAMAIACEPALLIADEPTTGLDVTTQQTVMELLARHQGRARHGDDPDHPRSRPRGALVRPHRRDGGRAGSSSRAPTAALFEAPQHPYTRRLVAASPTAASTLADLAPDDARRSCRSRVERKPGTPPLLERADVVKSLRRPTPRGRRRLVRASPPGGSLGLVGESGSGKSTLSRLVCRLIDPDDGDIVFDGESIGRIPARDFHRSPHRARHPDRLPGPERQPQPALSPPSTASPIRCAGSKACATARR